jgi:hypothetical protein
MTKAEYKALDNLMQVYCLLADIVQLVPDDGNMNEVIGQCEHDLDKVLKFLATGSYIDLF